MAQNTTHALFVITRSQYVQCMKAGNAFFALCGRARDSQISCTGSHCSTCARPQTQRRATDHSDPSHGRRNDDSTAPTKSSDAGASTSDAAAGSTAEPSRQKQRPMKTCTGGGVICTRSAACTSAISWTGSGSSLWLASRFLEHLNAARDAATPQHAVHGAQRLNQRVVPHNKLRSARRSHG